MRALRLFLFLLLATGCFRDEARAQAPQLPGQPLGLDNAPQRDTTKRTADPGWRDESARIRFRPAHSEVYAVPDSGLTTLHRRPVALPWSRDLGNLGSPAQPLFFEPQTAVVTPSLGYRVFDAYRFLPDSLRFYNTTRPYSEFRYQLGTKLEQWAQVLHTQNITPAWNFAFQYRKITSPGFYRYQRTNHDAAALTTQYQSPNLRYRLQVATVFNSMQNDENGGVAADSFLTASRYTDRATVPVRFQSANYTSIRRSPVFNNTRDAGLVLEHGYTWGRRDTIYAPDSTSYRSELTPRFRIVHRLDAGSQRHDFKDLAPDSLRYAPLFTTRFPGGDSVYSRQSWTWVDNGLSLNSLFGPRDRQVRFTAGAGFRTDRFRTLTQRAEEAFTDLSTYVFGAIGQEATTATAWTYAADAKLFVAGPAAGAFRLSGTVRRDFGRLGAVQAGAMQQLGQAPYNYQVYRTDYFERRASFSKEGQTLLWGVLENSRLAAAVGVRNWLLTNYLYLDASQNFAQAGAAFSVLQAWGSKTFRFGRWASAHEVTLQQVSGNGPVNLPLVAGRSTIGLETRLFRRALAIATGLEVRYNTPYAADGYSPFFNRFYYQNAVTIANIPEGTVYFNFRVKRFRASFSGDNLQALLVRKPVLTRPGYPIQDFMIRFGFVWGLVN